MATYNTIIEQTKTRPCWVNGRRAIFHRWVDSARPAKARGEENDPEAKYFQLYSVHALVEYEDGTVARVWPAVLQFPTSAEFAAYDWEGMEAQRDALPYTYDDPAEKATEETTRSCVTCGYDNPHFRKCVEADYICRKCDALDCQCRNCDNGSLWIPQGGTNG